MSYIIYNIESTYYLTDKTFKTEGAAKSFMTRTAKKADRRVEVNNIYKRLDRSNLRYSELMDALIAEGMTKREAYNADRTGDEFNRDEYAIAETTDFINNIEKMVTRVNLMSKEKYEDRTNTPYFMRLDRETYWSR